MLNNRYKSNKNNHNQIKMKLKIINSSCYRNFIFLAPVFSLAPPNPSSQSPHSLIGGATEHESSNICSFTQLSIICLWVGTLTWFGGSAALDHLVNTAAKGSVQDGAKVE